VAPEILDPVAGDDVFCGHGRRAEHTLRDPRQRVDAIPPVDIDLAAYPMLAWRWFIELPIRSQLDERTRESDDHPARLFIRFLTDRGEKRASEVIWGNRLKPGEYK
jgi:hypothetical protein